MAPSTRSSPTKQHASPPAKQLASSQKASTPDMEAATQALYGMLANVAFMIITNQIIKYFNLTDPSYLLYVRIGFAATHAAIITALFILRMRIGSRPDDGKSAKKIVEVDEPSGVAGQPPARKRLSVKEYDLQELSKQIRSVATGVLFSMALHYLFKSSHLLIIGSVNAVRSLLMSPLFKIHVFGADAEGMLERPFKDPPSPFAELLKTFMGSAIEHGGEKEEKAKESDESSSGEEEENEDESKSGSDVPSEEDEKSSVRRRN